MSAETIPAKRDIVPIMESARPDTCLSQIHVCHVRLSARVTRTGGGGDVSRKGSARRTRDDTEVDITTRHCRNIRTIINSRGEKSGGDAGADTFIVETKTQQSF